MTSKTPPRLAIWLLKQFCWTVDKEAILGDLEERYQGGKTDVWYWKQALVSIAVSAHKNIGTVLGFTMGVIAGGVSIAGNIVRGDIHTVRIFPSIGSLVVWPIIIYFMVYFATRRWRSTGAGTVEVYTAVRHAALIAALVFCLLVAAFTVWWFPRYPARDLGGLFALAVFGTAVGLLMFAIVLAFGSAAARTAARIKS